MFLNSAKCNLQDSRYQSQEHFSTIWLEVIFIRVFDWSFWTAICISRIFYSTLFSTLLVFLWFAEFRKYLRVLIARWRVGQIKIQYMDTLRREWINTQLRIRAGCTRFFSVELSVFRVSLMILLMRGWSPNMNLIECGRFFHLHTQGISLIFTLTVILLIVDTIYYPNSFQNDRF